MKLSDISIHAWILENKIRNEKGEPIEFRRHPFLFHIYSDESQYQCGLKPAQIGWSTLEILKTFYFAAKRKMDLIYTLPTDEDVRTFVSGKVNRIINQNPILQQYCKDKDTIEQKQVGHSMIYYRGTYTSRKAIMVTADWLVHDEKDSSDQSVIREYQARLQHSKLKWHHTFSHPSVPGHGVDVEWQNSDQKHWFITCPHCNKRHFMEWPDSINPKTAQFVCKYCSEPIGDDIRRRGEWVKKYKGRKYSGYWISQLMCPWVSAEEIIRKWNDPEVTEEFFYNKILGLPFEGEGNTVNAQDIYRNCTTITNSQDNVVIGADSGLFKHFVVGNKEGIFYHGATETWKDIEALLHRFPGSVLVLDALPDLTAPRELQQKYPGRVYLCHYARDRKTQQLIRWGKKDEEGTVIADRNRMIQLVIDEFRQCRIPLQGRATDWEPYVKHFQNIFRVKEYDSMDRPVFEWKKKNTEDHWVHATVYWRIAMSRFGQGESGIIMGGDGGMIPAEKGVEIDRAIGEIPAPNPKKIFVLEDKTGDWRTY